MSGRGPYAPPPADGQRNRAGLADYAPRAAREAACDLPAGTGGPAEGGPAYLEMPARGQSVVKQSAAAPPGRCPERCVSYRLQSIQADEPPALAAHRAARSPGTAPSRARGEPEGPFHAWCAFSFAAGLRKGGPLFGDHCRRIIFRSVVEKIYVHQLP